MLPRVLQKELILRTIKVLDIGFLTVLYFLLAASVSIFIDNQMGKFNPKEADKKSMWRLFWEIFLHLHTLQGT